MFRLFVLTCFISCSAFAGKSNDWVREFHINNGGGHKWSATKLQTTYKEALRCFNWSKCNEASGQCGAEVSNSFFGFNCSHVASSFDPNCRARATFPNSYVGSNVLSYLGLLELKGIENFPQDSLDSHNIDCLVDPYDQRVSSNRKIGDYISSRNIFSKNKVNCIGAGTNVRKGTPEQRCCTGNISNGRCTLPDYSNLSVFFNRFVSSTAIGYSYDSKTGYLQKPDVAKLACMKMVCESGAIASGKAISSLGVRGADNFHVEQIIRFIDGDDESNNFKGDADLFNSGLKWNDHFYCVPKGLEDSIHCN